MTASTTPPPPDAGRDRPPQPQQDVMISEMDGPGDAAAFAAMNRAWIEEFFELVEADRQVLDDPQTTIIERGGAVLLARAQGAVLGCVVVVPAVPQEPQGTWELSKMAVVPAARRRGIARALLARAIEQARAGGARHVLLGSNTVHLAPAIALYESSGFTHLDPGQAPPSPYARANTFMRLTVRP